MRQARNKLSFILQIICSSKFNPRSKLVNLSKTDTSVDRVFSVLGTVISDPEQLIMFRRDMKQFALDKLSTRQRFE